MCAIRTFSTLSHIVSTHFSKNFFSNVKGQGQRSQYKGQGQKIKNFKFITQSRFLCQTKALREQSTELKTVFEYLAPFKSYSQKTGKFARTSERTRAHLKHFN